MLNGLQWSILIGVCVIGIGVCLYIMLKSYRKHNKRKTEYKIIRDKLTETRKPLMGDPAPLPEPEEEYVASPIVSQIIGVLLSLVILAIITIMFVPMVTEIVETGSAINVSSPGGVIPIESSFHMAILVFILFFMVLIFSTGVVFNV